MSPAETLPGAVPASIAPRPANPRPAALMPALLLNVLISSGTFLVAKRTIAEFPPLALAMLRFALATSLVVPVTRLLRPGKRIARSDRPRLVLLGILAVPLNQALFLVGMQWASASHAALLYALTPALVILAGTWLGAGRPSRLQMLGVVLAFAGVFTLLLQRGLHFDRASLRGDLVIVAAVVAWALYLALARDVIRRYGPLVVTAEALLAGTLVYLPIGLVSLFHGFDPARVSLQGWGGLLYLAWLTSGLNYVIWFWGIEHLKPATVALITNLQPVVTAAMAWSFLREPLPAGFVLSTALVIGGVWIAQARTLGAARPRAPEHR